MMIIYLEMWKKSSHVVCYRSTEPLKFQHLGTTVTKPFKSFIIFEIN